MCIRDRVKEASQQRGLSLNQLIVSSLEKVFGEAATSSPPDDSVSARAERLRAILGNLVIRFEPSDFASILPLDATPEEREAFRDLFPILNPPLSQTIIEDREDRL